MKLYKGEVFIMNIYQEIWNVDIEEGNGIRPILKDKDINIEKNKGYVVVNMKGIITSTTNEDHNILQDLNIPDSKKLIYKIFHEFFDNYEKDASGREIYSKEKEGEINKFLELIIESPSIKLAKSFIEKEGLKFENKIEWIKYLKELWFTQFNQNNGVDLTGFEHVFMGEQKGEDKLSGYHFWYKYWLDDDTSIIEKYGSPEYEVLDIKIATGNQPDTSPSPDVVTLIYDLIIKENGKEIKLEKRPKGGFFVGISPECLIALGTVAYSQKYKLKTEYEGKRDRDGLKNPVIKLNGIKYELAIYKCKECYKKDRIRTFYPIYYK